MLDVVVREGCLFWEVNLDGLDRGRLGNLQVRWSSYTIP